MKVAVEKGAGPRPAPDETRPGRGLHGLTRTLVTNMVNGVTTGLRAVARDQRRRLQGRGEGAGSSLRPRLLAPDRLPPPRGRHRRGGQGPRTTTRATWAHATGRQDLLGRHRRQDPRRCVRPSPTRARASSTSEEPIRRKDGKTGTPSVGFISNWARAIGHRKETKTHQGQQAGKRASTGRPASGGSCPARRSARASRSTRASSTSTRR